MPKHTVSPLGCTCNVCISLVFRQFILHGLFSVQWTVPWNWKIEGGIVLGAIPEASCRRTGEYPKDLREDYILTGTPTQVSFDSNTGCFATRLMLCYSTHVCVWGGGPWEGGGGWGQKYRRMGLGENNPV